MRRSGAAGFSYTRIQACRGAWVLTGKGLGRDEDGAVGVVELDRALPGELEVLALVVSDGDMGCSGGTVNTACRRAVGEGRHTYTARCLRPAARDTRRGPASRTPPPAHPLGSSTPPWITWTAQRSGEASCRARAPVGCLPSTASCARGSPCLSCKPESTSAPRGSGPARHPS